MNTPRKQGGLGEMKIPLLADKSCAIARSYGVLKEDAGIPFRGLFIIDRQQTMRQITINDLPVGRSVDETLRLVQAFMFTDEHGEGNRTIFVCLEFVYDGFLRCSLPSWLEARLKDHEARPCRQQGLLQGCLESTVRRCLAVDQFHHFFCNYFHP